MESSAVDPGATNGIPYGPKTTSSAAAPTWLAIGAPAGSNETGTYVWSVTAAGASALQVDVEPAPGLDAPGQHRGPGVAPAVLAVPDAHPLAVRPIAGRRVIEQVRSLGRADCGVRDGAFPRGAPTTPPPFLPSPPPRAAMKASWGTSTRPTIFMRFLPSFCFSSSLRLRVMSPP